jgi:DnaK suppressor protein
VIESPCGTVALGHGATEDPAGAMPRAGPTVGCMTPTGADIDLAAVRRELQARQDGLQARLGRLTTPPERGAELGFGKRIGDGTLEAVSRLTDIGVGQGTESAEARVSRALVKLDEGSYGICDACGGPIASARLRAAPDSVLCIGCARGARR